MSSKGFNGIVDAIRYLHTKHGTGDIKQIRVYLSGLIEVSCSKKDKVVIYRGSVKHNKVRLHSHVASIYELE